MHAGHNLRWLWNVWWEHVSDNEKTLESWDIDILLINWDDYQFFLKLIKLRKWFTSLIYLGRKREEESNDYYPLAEEATESKGITLLK